VRKNLAHFYLSQRLNVKSDSGSQRSKMFSLGILTLRGAEREDFPPIIPPLLCEGGGFSPYYPPLPPLAEGEDQGGGNLAPKTLTKDSYGCIFINRWSIP